MTTPDRIAGERLRARREEIGLSPAELAIAWGVHIDHLSDYERGARSLTDAQQRELEDLLEVPLGHFKAP